MRTSERYDGTSLHEEGLLPQRSVVAVDDASTLVVLTAEVVNPHALGEVDAVADIITLSISSSILIDRSHEIPGTKHVLILCSLTQGVGILSVEEHGTHHGHTEHGLTSDTVSIGCQYRLPLQV